MHGLQAPGHEAVGPTPALWAAAGAVGAGPCPGLQVLSPTSCSTQIYWASAPAPPPWLLGPAILHVQKGVRRVPVLHIPSALWAILASRGVGFCLGSEFGGTYQPTFEDKPCTADPSHPPPPWGQTHLRPFLEPLPHMCLGLWS